MKIIERFDAVSNLIARLDTALEQSDWEAVERLLEQRQAAIESAFADQLPEQYAEQARNLLAILKQQDTCLAAAAKKLKATTSEELIKLHKQQKTVDAYKA